MGFREELPSALSTLAVIKRGMCYHQEFSLTLFDYLIKVVSAKSLSCEASCHPFPEYTLTHTTDVLNSTLEETGSLPNTRVHQRRRY